MPSIQEISTALIEIAEPNMKPKRLFKAARAKYPGISKKDLVRAAFYAVITCSDRDVAKARTLQDMALVERAGD